MYGATTTVNCSGGWQRRQLRDKDIQRRKVDMPAGVSRRGRGVPGPSEFLFEASDSHPSCAALDKLEKSPSGHAAVRRGEGPGRPSRCARLPQDSGI